MSLVKDRQTHYITTAMTGTGKFSKNMWINEADEIRIVQIIYVGTDTDGVYRVAWDGVIECFALFDVGHQAGNVNIRHNIHGKALQGTQNFTVFNQNNTVATVLAGELGIVFEAIKY